MGRRKRKRKVILRPRRMLPKIFTCPHCGAQLVTVKKTVDLYLEGKAAPPQRQGAPQTAEGEEERGGDEAV
jgi:hypothetical protein